jgi:hypothetical protein
MSIALVIDIPESDPSPPTALRALIASGPRAMDRVRELDAARDEASLLSGMRVLAPIPNPS